MQGTTIQRIPKISLLLFWVVVIVFSVTGQTHLTGDISETVFDPEGNPYIVEKDIVIPQGKELRIPAGCVFLFKPFTGLTVEGGLIVEGTEQLPVFFSSIHDDEFNPNTEKLPAAFDWNGILIERSSSGVELAHFELAYSVFGLKSLSRQLVINSGVFHDNGQFHFTIHGEIQPVKDAKPFYFNFTPAKEQSEQSAMSPEKKKKIIWTTTGSTLFVGGAGLIAAGYEVFYKDALKYKDRYQKQVAAGKALSDEAQQAEENVKTSSAYSVTAFSVGALCVTTGAAIAISALLPPKAPVSVSPTHRGVQLVYSF